MLDGDDDEEEVGDEDARKDDEVKSIDSAGSHVDHGRKEDDVEKGRWNEPEGEDVVGDSAAAGYVSDHHHLEKEKVDEPADDFAGPADEFFGHGDEVRVRGHPAAHFEKEQAGAEHEGPAGEVDEDGGEKTARSSHDRKG